MPAPVVTESLNCSDGAEGSHSGVERSFEKSLQAAVGTMTKLGKQLTIILEVDAQNLRQGKNILTMGNGIEDVAA